MLREFLAVGSIVASLTVVAMSAGSAPANANRTREPAATASATQDSDSDSGPPTIMEPGGCGAALDNPHYSAGASGVIVKTRYICDVGYSMTVTGALTYLYYCGNTKPSGGAESTWTGTYGCAPVRSSNYSSFSVGSGRTITRYTPPTGQNGATGKGWYVACTRYYRAGQSASIRVWSPIVKVTW
jgi:hypothetical protein